MPKLQHKFIKGQRIVVNGYARFVDFKGQADFPSEIAKQIVDSDPKWRYALEPKPAPVAQKVEFVAPKVEKPKAKAKTEKAEPKTKKPALPEVNDDMTKAELIKAGKNARRKKRDVKMAGFLLMASFRSSV